MKSLVLIGLFILASYSHAQESAPEGAPAEGTVEAGVNAEGCVPCGNPQASNVDMFANTNPKPKSGSVLPTGTSSESTD